jgi:hypothetical protein
MLPTPASIRAAPSAKSRPSCNPAVPPPPVTGAAFGITVVVEVAEAVTVSVTVGVTWVGAGVLEVTPGVPEVVVPEEGVLPSEAGAVPGLVTDVGGLGIFGVEDEAPLQAETVARASRARAPQQMAVSLAPSAVPALVVRTFIGPPHARGR